MIVEKLPDNAYIAEKAGRIMIGKTLNPGQTDLFLTRLTEMINPANELVLLAQKIDWKSLEKEFAPLYSNYGAPAKRIRLMAGILLLKQMYNLGDETIIPVWIQNPYMQYFCGEVFFQWEQPFDPSDLVHFRKRLGVEGVERLLKASLSLFSAEIQRADVVLVDTTAQEKDITFPTDVKLQTKIIKKCQAIAKREDIELRQSYTQTLKKLQINLRFSHHPKRKKEALKARRKLKTIAGRLSRDLERKMDEAMLNKYGDMLALFKKVLSQELKSKNKIYSLHEPDVSCIAKGKAHKPYEFGSKVGIVMIPKINIIAGVVNFQGNPHDSTTLEPSLEQAKAMTGKYFKKAVVDRGYRGKQRVNGTEIIIPGGKKDQQLSPAQRKAKSRLCRSRAAIEPIIGHLKYDCRLIRSYLKGVYGDQVNAILAAAAFNLRQWMNKNSRATLFWLRFFRLCLAHSLNLKKLEFSGLIFFSEISEF